VQARPPRSLTNLIELVNRLASRQIAFRSITARTDETPFQYA
jgi:hypothetical protein